MSQHLSSHSYINNTPCWQSQFGCVTSRWQQRLPHIHSPHRYQIRPDKYLYSWSLLTYQLYVFIKSFYLSTTYTIIKSSYLPPMQAFTKPSHWSTTYMFTRFFRLCMPSRTLYWTVYTHPCCIFSLIGIIQISINVCFPCHHMLVITLPIMYTLNSCQLWNKAAHKFFMIFNSYGWPLHYFMLLLMPKF